MPRSSSVLYLPEKQAGRFIVRLGVLKLLSCILHHWKEKEHCINTQICAIAFPNHLIARPRFEILVYYYPFCIFSENIIGLQYVRFGQTRILGTVRILEQWKLGRGIGLHWLPQQRRKAHVILINPLLLSLCITFVVLDIRNKFTVLSSVWNEESTWDIFSTLTCQCVILLISSTFNLHLFICTFCVW